MLEVQRLPERTQQRANRCVNLAGDSDRRLDSDTFPGTKMSGTLLASPARSVDRGDDVSRPLNGRADATNAAFTSHVVVERDVCVVRVAGELDLSSAAHAMRSCLDVGRLVVCVDLGELTFMDCGGYRGLVGARRELERRGGSLTCTGAVGEPARLLDLLGVK